MMGMVTRWWGQQKNWHFILQICLLLVGGYVAWIYSGQLDQMIESNKINRDSLQTVQRAFVFASDIEPRPIENAVGFMVKWQNSGTTPTRDLHMHVSYLATPNIPLPDDFSFPDLWTEGAPHVNVLSVIGPKATMGSPAGPIQTPIIDAVYERRQRLYFWGWAEYKDVFENTPTHITKFCYELIITRKEPARPKGFTYTIRLDTWPRHNCYDKDCDQEK
jgi:hypothetical protein